MPSDSEQSEEVVLRSADSLNVNRSTKLDSGTRNRSNSKFVPTTVPSSPSTMSAAVSPTSPDNPPTPASPSSGDGSDNDDECDVQALVQESLENATVPTSQIHNISEREVHVPVGAQLA